MNAALLNKARPAHPVDWTPSQTMGLPVTEGLPPELIEVTNDAALWGTEALGESKRGEAFDAEKLIGWVETGAVIQRANKVATGGVGLAALFLYMNRNK